MNERDKTRNSSSSSSVVLRDDEGIDLRKLKGQACPSRCTDRGRSGQTSHDGPRAPDQRRRSEETSLSAELPAASYPLPMILMRYHHTEQLLSDSSVVLFSFLIFVSSHSVAEPYVYRLRLRSSNRPSLPLCSVHRIRYFLEGRKTNDLSSGR